MTVRRKIKRLVRKIRMSYILPPGSRESIAILSEDKKVFAGPFQHRGYVHDSMTFLFYPEYAALWAQFKPHPLDLDKRPNLERPEFVLWCSLKRMDKNGEKFRSIINQVESRLGLEQRTDVVVPGDTGLSDVAGPFIAQAPNFWIRSPISLSVYALFLKLSIRMKLGESLDDFIGRMLDAKESAYNEAKTLRIANKLGNLKGFFDRSLPCLNREGYSDYLLSADSRDLAWYHAPSDSTLPMNETGLRELRIEGRKFELSRMELDNG